MKKLVLLLAMLPTISQSSFAQWSTGSGTIFPTTITDNVGIGLTAPQALLSVGNNYPGSSEATNKGLIQIAGNGGGSLTGGGGLEFKTSAAVSGFGWMISSADLGYSNVPLAISYRNNSSAWTNAMLIDSRNGYIGIGTTTPTSLLTVGPSLSGSVISSALATNAGTLGTTAGSEMALSSTAFIGGNAVSFGVRAYRVSDGTDWRSTAIGLGMDVDNTIRAGANLWLLANGYVGIGTMNAAYALDVLGAVHATSDFISTQSSTGGVGAHLINTDATGYSTVTLENTGAGGKAFQVGIGGHSSGQADKLYVYNINTGTVPFAIDQSDHVGIGTSNPDEMLTVNGTVHSTEVRVTAGPLPDYVFKSDYKLRKLADVKTYINANHHLPEMPAAAVVEANGMALGEMNTKLLKKVEELTLYLIQQKEQNDTQQKQIDQLNKKLQRLVENTRKTKK